MRKETRFTEGKILGPLMAFALPVLFALFLQAMYGAVDLLVAGKFAAPEDVSAVSTGSQIMLTLGNLVSSLAMGTTVYFGQQLGMGNAKRGGEIIGASIALFLAVGVLLSLSVPFFAVDIARTMNAPDAAFSRTVSYIRICGGGMMAIVAYNLIGSIFRGMGDSTTPLLTVGIACVCNVIGDLILIALFHLGAAGAALATVMAQLVSVLCSLVFISRQKYPFDFHRSMVRFAGGIIKQVLKLGIPIAFQDLLVGLSFLVIQAVVNALGVTASSGVGVAEKVCGFIMLVPIAFEQSISAFAAQNIGAGKADRALRALRSAVTVSFVFGVSMSLLSFFGGISLCGIFAKDAEIINAGAEYLKAYAIDCLLTCFLFCFIGFYNGLGTTRFVMVQGIAGAFCVRIPVCLFMSRWEPVTLFHIGLSTPCSTVAQIVLCFLWMAWIRKRTRLLTPEV